MVKFLKDYNALTTFVKNNNAFEIHKNVLFCAIRDLN